MGQALSRRLGWRFADLDERIERSVGRSIADIFSESGETGFRAAERAVLRTVLEEFGTGPAVIALGGGTFVQPESLAALRTHGGTTVFLDAPVEELWQRCQEAVERPLRRDVQHFRHLYETRRPEYMKASIRVDTAAKNVETIVSEIIQLLGLAEQNSIRRER